MSQSPLETLFSGLRDALDDFPPEAAGNRIRPVLEGFFQQFQMVPKREYDAHMAALARLEETVADLESRIARLEQSG